MSSSPGSWSQSWTWMAPLPLRSTSRGDPPNFFLNRLVATVERPGWYLIRCSVQQSLPQMIPRHLFLNPINIFVGENVEAFFLNSQVEPIGALEIQIGCFMPLTFLGIPFTADGLVYHQHKHQASLGWCCIDGSSMQKFM